MVLGSFLLSPLQNKPARIRVNFHRLYYKFMCKIENVELNMLKINMVKTLDLLYQYNICYDSSCQYATNNTASQDKSRDK